MIRRAVRPPVVAGRFYPADAGELEATVRRLLAVAAPAPGPAPVAIVSPHAGYAYSGPVAGSAYGLVASASGRFRRVVLIGPSHFVAFRGLALPECDALASPLGEHAVDADGVSALGRSPAVRRWAPAHRDEHCLEVQLPFLWVALGPLPVLPLVTGVVADREVADALELVWTADTLVVASSDLSHYMPYAEARQADTRTAAAVEQLRTDGLGDRDACGVNALRGLVEAARRRGLRCRCVDLRSSGDTSGDRRRVVGYGAFGFWEGDLA